MADATAGRVGNDLVRYSPGSRRIPVQFAMGENFYANTLVGVLASDGFAYPFDATEAYTWVGLITEDVDTTADAADGDTVGDIWVGVSAKFVAAGLVQADQGKLVYGQDNQTVAITQGGTEEAVGYIDEVESATEALVFIPDTPAGLIA